MNRGIVALCALGGLAAAAHAQVTPMIITEFNTDRAIIVQNGQLVRSFTLNSTDENAMAVFGANDIRTVGRNAGQNGQQYDEFGNLLGGGPYDNDAVGASDFYDGTTDGINNYSISHNGGPFDVFSADDEWNGATSIFTPTRRSSGIAYDPVNNTLWTSATVGTFTEYQEYTLGGTLLNDFSVGVPGTSGYGMAYDPGSDTFFITARDSSGFDLFQVDRNGNLLNSIDVPGISGRWMGIEPIPAPGALALLGLGGLAAARRRR